MVLVTFLILIISLLGKITPATDCNHEKSRFVQIKSRIVSLLSPISTSFFDTSKHTAKDNVDSSKTEVLNFDSNKKRGTKRRKEELADMADNFDIVYKKWKKRPAELDCSMAPSTPQDRRSNKERLRIVSYNAEWLFLYGGNGTVKCPGSACRWSNLSEARDHVLRTLSLIRKLDADIIHLNEIEDCRILRVLMDLLPYDHGYRAYLIPGTDTATGQNVGLLTRVDPIVNLMRTEQRQFYPVPGSTCVHNLKTSPVSSDRKRSLTGISKHYLTHFQVGELKLLWAGAHFIAQPKKFDRCLRREAQATLLSYFVNREHFHDEEIIITGDFNDHDEEVIGPSFDNPQSSVLKILKATKVGLISAASYISDRLQRYTSWHDVNQNCIDDGPEEHSLIDHVLLSPGLANRISSVWMDHNITVSCQDRTSDHWPIIIDFDV